MDELRKKICVWLKRKGCYIFLDESMVILLYEGFWGALLIKKSPRAKVSPTDKKALEKMNDWSWARIAWPENWPEIQKELEEMLK